MRNDRGFTLIELLIVVAIISIIAAIAVPSLLKNRMAASEVSAVGSLHSITQAQILYSASCGNGGFASSFTVLGVATPGSTETFLSSDLTSSATPQKSGYKFTLGPGAGAAAGPNDCNGTATVTAYYATAVPLSFGSTGGRSFAVNASNTIWQLSAPTAPTEPFGPPATPIQ